MEIPKKTKYRKYYKVSVQKIEIKKTKLCYGVYGIKAISNGFLKMGQIKRIKDDLVKKLKGKSNLYFNFFPLFSLTAKGDARMGSGKGDISDWYFPVKAGRILIEFAQCKVPKGEIEKILKGNSVKWPINVQLTELKKHLDETKKI